MTFTTIKKKKKESIPVLRSLYFIGKIQTLNRCVNISMFADNKCCGDNSMPKIRKDGWESGVLFKTE